MGFIADSWIIREALSKSTRIPNIFAWARVSFCVFNSPIHFIKQAMELKYDPLENSKKNIYENKNIHELV